jgi:VWFA-related protein
VIRLRALALVAALVAVSAIAVAQAPTFSAKVEAVRVDALVVEGGRPVLGLGPRDFEILDDGVSQTVDMVSFERIPLNVILALDVSGSVSGERLANLRAASRDLLAGLASDDQSALVTFSHVVRLQAPLAQDTGKMRAALERIVPQGGTALRNAAYASLVLADSDAGRGLVILFTDGIDTSSYLSRDDVLDTARRSDAVVYAASAGRGRKIFLQDLTRQTGGRLIELESTKDLARTFMDILNEFRQRYLLSYSPRGVSRDGWHELTVRLKAGRRGTVMARPGYMAGAVVNR